MSSTKPRIARLASAEEALDHYTALIYGGHRSVIRTLAKRLDIEVVELT